MILRKEVSGGGSPALPVGLVSRSINMAMFADGAWEGRSRSEEEVMQGHRRRRATQRSPAIPISPKGAGGTASISLSLLLHDVTDIASSSLREPDAVALATNVTIIMERGTYPRLCLFLVNPNSGCSTLLCLGAHRRDCLKSRPTQVSCVGAHGRAPYRLLIKQDLWAHSRAPLQALIKIKGFCDTL